MPPQPRPMLPPRLRRALALAALLWAAPALAQQGGEPAPGPTPDPAPGLHREDPGLFEDWTIRFEPSVWNVAPGGRLHFPGEPAGTPDRQLSDFNLDSPRLSPFGELHIRAADRWRFTISGFAFSAEDRGAIATRAGSVGPLAISPGDQLNSSLTFASGEVSAGWRIPFELGGQFRDFAGRVEVVGGARLTHVDLDIDTPAGSVDQEHFFLEPILGGKLSMDITETFTVDIQNTFGYFNDGGGKSMLSWDIFVGFMYFPVENVGAQIGFRQYLFRMDDGEDTDKFEFNGALAGLYGGLTIRF